jgi:protein phosphatase PTC7
MEEEKKSTSSSKSYAEIVKDSETPPRKRQDLKISPSSKEKDENHQSESLGNHNSSFLVSEKRADVICLSDNSRIKELNSDILCREKELSVGEYFQLINDRIFQIKSDFMSQFMSLVGRDDFCVDGNLLKAYGIQSSRSSSSHTLKLLEKCSFIEGRDYRVDTKITDKKISIHYWLTPIAFKKLLLRSKNTDSYANYYMLLEKCTHFYHEYQIEMKRKKIEQLIETIRIQSTNEFEFSIGHSFHKHKEDAGWIGESAGIVGFCVVDGIGGYRDKAIDSGITARTFTSVIQKKFETNEQTFLQFGYSPERMLLDGWRGVREQNILGGITVVVGLIDSALNLRICKIGDCSVFVLRETPDSRYTIAFKSVDNEKMFNTPFMLAHDCPTGVEQACSQLFALKKTDIVFACSDGFTDNLRIEKLTDSKKRDFLKTKSALEIKIELLKLATEYSQSPNESPFSEKAQANGLRYSGGKPDDITLAVIKV